MKTDLTFEQLRDANVTRCETAFHKVDEWKPWEWSNAMAGESGEACVEMLALVTALAAKNGAACNITKKMNRIWPANQFIKNWNKPEDQRMEELAEKLADEIADVVIYADLLAARIGRTLADCVQKKFNEKSREIGSTVLLPE